MPSTYQRLRVEHLLECTWVSSDDQTPANAPATRQASSIECERSELPQIAWPLQRPSGVWSAGLNLNTAAWINTVGGKIATMCSEAHNRSTATASGHGDLTLRSDVANATHEHLILARREAIEAHFAARIRNPRQGVCTLGNEANLRFLQRLTERGVGDDEVNPGGCGA